MLRPQRTKHPHDPQQADRDWEQAEQIQSNPVRRSLFRINQPLIATERKLEQLLAYLRQAALLEILGLLGNLGLVVAVLLYFGTEKQRRDIEVYTAWQTITSAYGQPGNGGRIRSLEFLNASPGANWRRRTFPFCWRPQLICWFWEAESLAGVDVSGAWLAYVNLQDAYLRQANLQESELVEANLQKAFLWEANLQEAYLWGVNLQEAFLGEANLQGAYLRQANLQESRLVKANLQEAYLWEANLQKAFLVRTNLQEVSLWEANLQEAYLWGVNLQEAFLWEASLQGAILMATDLRDTQGLTLCQLNHQNPPYLCNVALPDSIQDVDPNRDCAVLPSVLAEHFGKYGRGNISIEEAREVVEDARQQQWE